MARPRRDSAPFPHAGLQDALRVARAIKAGNGGMPWMLARVAEALMIAKDSDEFRVLTTASQMYGLTAQADEFDLDPTDISITPLGRQVVYAQSREEELARQTEAFLNVPAFRGAVERFGGIHLPESAYLANILDTKFDIPPGMHEKFIDIYLENCFFLGIGDESTGSEAGADSEGQTATHPAPVSALGLADQSVAAQDRSGNEEKGEPICFVIMPFHERDGDDRYHQGFFLEVLEYLFTPAAKEAGFTVKTALREGSDVIQRTIVRDLLAADLVLADLTAHNPNVLFELGMRMHADKPVALVKASGTQPIFDVDSMLRVVEYDPRLRPKIIAADVLRIRDHILGAWESRDSVDTFMKLLGPST